MRSGTEVAVVIGGGNFFRGAQLNERGMDRSRADYMGMLGTVMNCLALQDFCDRQGVETRVQTAIRWARWPSPTSRAARSGTSRRAASSSSAPASGRPTSPPTPPPPSARWRSACEVVLMAKGVDGVYDADPRTNPDATRFETLTHAEVLARGLKVADATAISLCQRQRPADHRVQPARRGQHRPRRAG